MSLLDEIDAAQRQLNDVDDQLCAAIAAIESGLRQRIATRIELRCEGGRFAGIAFGKLNGAWHLVVEISGSQTPLASCSRELRADVLSSGFIERLIAESASTIRAQVDGRKAASAAASQILMMLNQQGDRP